jgi:hypothetical protein
MFKIEKENLNIEKIINIIINKDFFILNQYKLIEDNLNIDQLNYQGFYLYNNPKLIWIKYLSLNYLENCFYFQVDLKIQNNKMDYIIKSNKMENLYYIHFEAEILNENTKNSYINFTMKIFEINAKIKIANFIIEKIKNQVIKELNKDFIEIIKKIN